MLNGKSQQHSWTKVSTRTSIKRTTNLFENVLRSYDTVETDCYRTAAYTVALERVAEAHQGHGSSPDPNVYNQSC